MRWDPWVPPNDLNGTLVAFKPGVQSTIAPGAPAGLLFHGDTGIQSTVFQKSWKDFAPRAGFAYDVAGQGKTSGTYGQITSANSPRVFQFGLKLMF